MRTRGRRPAAIPLAEATIDPDQLRVPAGPGAMHVERYGHGGAPVVLVHGFGTDCFLWRAIAPPLAAEGHTPFAVDLLGYGESDRPLDADFGIAAQAEYLDAAMTQLRIARAAVVGVDVGGLVALRLAATRPDRVARLVLINTPDEEEIPSEDVKRVQRGTARYPLRVTRSVLGAAPLLTPVLQGSVADPDRMPERLIARYLAPYAGRDGVLHLLTLARALRADDIEDADLDAIVAPTLVLWGEEDRWLGPRTADRLVNSVPGASLVRFPGIGRLFPEDAPERLVAELREFLTVHDVV